MPPPRPFSAFAAALACLALVLAAGPAAAGEWVPIRDEDGVQVWKRTVEGSPILEFRGQARVRADVRTITAVLRGVDRMCEWRANCVRSEGLAWRSVGQGVVYYRTRSPVPFIADRDIVFDARFEIDREHHRVIGRFWGTSHPDAPPTEDAIRMPKMRGRWVLQPEDDGSTDVTYEILVDPGGWLPKWLVNWASRKLPFRGLLGLRKQVRKGGYEVQLAGLDAELDWSLLNGKAP